MTRSGIPKAALALGLAGVLPFVWGLLTMISPALAGVTQNTIGPRFVGPYVLVFYGTIILAFMSGAIWGFAARAPNGTAVVFYALSTLPALWAFFLVGGGGERPLWVLIIGHVGCLALDYGAWRRGLTPPWWIQLRVLLTSLVVLCLALAILL